MLFKCGVDKPFPLFYVSDNVDEILGFPPDYFLGDSSAWSDRIHPDDRKEVLASFSKIVKTGSEVNEYRFQLKNGKYIWLRDRLKLISDEKGNPQSIVGYSWVVARVFALDQQEGEKIKPYEHAIARCSHLLLNNRPDAVSKTLNILLEVADADRVYIFENHATEDGTLLASQKYEATRKDIAPQIDNPELQGVPYSVFPWWKEMLEQEKIINEQTRNLPPAEKELLESQGVKSVLILPIYLDGKWNGFIGFDDVQKERYWSQDEVQLLQMAARIYGSYKVWVKYQDMLTVQKNYNQAVIDSLPGMFLAMDEQFTPLQWNKNVEKITGLSSKDISANKNNFWELLTDQNVPEILQNRKVDEIEVSVFDEKNRKVPYLWKIETFEDGKNPIKLAIGLDISDQKRLLREIRKNEKLFKTLFSRSPVAIAMSNERGQIRMVNKSFEKLFGYTEKELIDKQINNVVLPEGEDSVGFQSGKNYGELLNLQVEAKRKTKDGRLLDMIVAGIPVYINDERIAGFGMYIDISDLKKVEKDLKDSLKEKQVLLQEIHHRVKNNLAVISSLFQLQIFEVDDPAVRRILKDSQSRLQTIALIHEKLYKSENLTRIDLNNYMNDLVDSIRQTFEINNRNIDVNINVDEVALNINKAIPFALLVNEILTNSYEHAFDNRDSGTIWIDIKKKDSKIEAELRDDGVGMGKEPDDKQGGLGMTLISNLVEQLEADYKMDLQPSVNHYITFETIFSKGSGTILDQ